MYKVGYIRRPQMYDCDTYIAFRLSIGFGYLKFITSVRLSRKVVDNVETIYTDPRSWTEVMMNFRVAVVINL